LKPEICWDCTLCTADDSKYLSALISKVKCPKNGRWIAYFGLLGPEDKCTKIRRNVWKYTHYVSWQGAASKVIWIFTNVFIWSVPVGVTVKCTYNAVFSNTQLTQLRMFIIWQQVSTAITGQHQATVQVDENTSKDK